MKRKGITMLIAELILLFQSIAHTNPLSKKLTPGKHKIEIVNAWNNLAMIDAFVVKK